MRKKYLVLCLISFTIFSACKKEVYYPGVVIIRANNEFQNGLIRSLDVYEADPDIENLGRAIVFKLEEEKPAFNLYDTVFYKVKCVDGIKIAYDLHPNDLYTGKSKNNNSKKIDKCQKLFTGDSITCPKFPQSIQGDGRIYIFQIRNGNAENIEEFDQSKYATKNQIYRYRNEYAINLHIADTHREGPQHINRHVRTPKFSAQNANALVDNDLYKVMSLLDDAGNELIAFVYDPNNVEAGTNIDYFLYEKDQPDNFDHSKYFYCRDSLGIVDFYALDFYDISTSHDHIIE